MTDFDWGFCKASITLPRSLGRALEFPPEQNPPQSIRRTSEVCIALLSGMANRLSKTARHAIQGLMRVNELINEIAAKWGWHLAGIGNDVKASQMRHIAADKLSHTLLILTRQYVAVLNPYGLAVRSSVID